MAKFFNTNKTGKVVLAYLLGFVLISQFFVGGFGVRVQAASAEPETAAVAEQNGEAPTANTPTQEPAEPPAPVAASDPPAPTQEPAEPATGAVPAALEESAPDDDLGGAVTFSADPPTYALYYHVGAWSIYWRAAEGELINKAPHVAPNPNTQGYEFFTFYGWYDAPMGGNLIDVNRDTMPARDLRLYARYSNKLTYIVDGVETVYEAVPFSNKLNDPANAPPATAKPGYVFRGWFEGPVNGLKADPNTKTMPRHDYALYARYVPDAFTVTFDIDGVKTVYNDLASGTSVAGKAPVIPEKEGYTISGWFLWQTGGTPQNPDTAVMPEDNLTFYAQYTKKNYPLTYHILGDETREYSVPVGGWLGRYVPVLEEKQGHTFLGWYDAKEGGNQVDPQTTSMPAKGYDLYARWDIEEYTLIVKHYLYGWDEESNEARLQDTDTYTLAYGSDFFPPEKEYPGYVMQGGAAGIIHNGVCHMEFYYQEATPYKIAVTQTLTLAVNDKHPAKNNALTEQELLALLQAKTLDPSGAEADVQPAITTDFNKVDFGKTGSTVVTVKATWENGATDTKSVTVQVVDKTAPAITVKTPNMTFAGGDVYPKTMQELFAKAGVTATDNYDDSVKTVGSLQGDVAFADIDWNKAGHYTVLVNARDASGNAATPVEIGFAVTAKEEEQDKDKEDEKDKEDKEDEQDKPAPPASKTETTQPAASEKAPEGGGTTPPPASSGGRQPAASSNRAPAASSSTPTRSTPIAGGAGTTGGANGATGAAGAGAASAGALAANEKDAGAEAETTNEIAAVEEEGGIISTFLNENGLPLFGSGPVWGLLNLVLAVLAAGMGAAAVVVLVRRKKTTRPTSRLLLLGASAIGAASLLLFIIVSSLGDKMVLINSWTPTFLVIGLVQLGALLAGRALNKATHKRHTEAGVS